MRENPQAVNAISVGNINDAVNIYDGWTVRVSFLPERDYVTSGYLLSQIRLSSVCLSVVCNVRTPYSAG